MTSLTLTETENILNLTKKKIQELGVKMSVSIVDPRGDLISMFRIDGASWRTPIISRGKALAAACFQLSGAELAPRMQEPVFQGFMATQNGNFIPGQGGLPIYKNGLLIGGIGASGGTGLEDEEVAKYGVHAAGLTVVP